MNYSDILSNYSKGTESPYLNSYDTQTVAGGGIVARLRDVTQQIPLSQTNSEQKSSSKTFEKNDMIYGKVMSRKKENANKIIIGKVLTLVNNQDTLEPFYYIVLTKNGNKVKIKADECFLYTGQEQDKFLNNINQEKENNSLFTGKIKPNDINTLWDV